MPEKQIETREPKICMHCETENEWQAGQCVSCGRTEFTTRKKQAANRKSSLKDIFLSLFLVGMSFYLMHIIGDKIFTDKTAFILVALVFFIAAGSLVNSIYKYRHARNILLWNIIIVVIYIIMVFWDYLAKFIR